MDNGPARIHRVSQGLQEAGDRISDMAEVSMAIFVFFSMNASEGLC